MKKIIFTAIKACFIVGLFLYLFRPETFGFPADKPGALVPGSSKPVLAREEGETYRTIDYMYSETTRLACQLKDMDGSASIDANPKLGQPLPRLGKPEER